MPSAIPTDRTPLTFTFRNSGPIENAELQLGDLTIVAGRNNTGKTYLVYSPYGFLKTWENWSGTALTPRSPASAASRSAPRYTTFEELSKQVADNGQAELSVDPDTLNRERSAAMNALTRRFSENGLAGVFSSPPEKFDNASIGVELGTEFPGSEVFAEPEDTPSIRYDGTSLSVAGVQPGSRRLHPMALGVASGAGISTSCSPSCRRTRLCFPPSASRFRSSTGSSTSERANSSICCRSTGTARARILIFRSI